MSAADPRGGDGASIRQSLGHTGQASALGRGVGAGPVLGLHSAPAGDQVLPGQRVNTIRLDSGPEGAIHDLARTMTSESLLTMGTTGHPP